MRKKVHNKPEYLVHKVQYTGETLGFIARWYTGNFDKWKEIQAYNAIKNPNAISLGQEIKVPTSIAIQDKAPPKSFFSGPRGAAPVKAVSKNTTSSVSDKPAVVVPAVESDVPTPAATATTTEVTPSTEASTEASVEAGIEATRAPEATKPAVQEEPLDDKTRDEILNELLKDSQ